MRRRVCPFLNHEVFTELVGLNMSREVNITGSLKNLRHDTFSSLRVRNYRLYFIGQGISLSGTWMQVIGQSWLVLKITNSGTALGFVVALQYLPLLVLAPLGGVVADRFHKRNLLYITQSCSGILALTLAILVVTDVVRLWMIFVLAATLGLVNSIDNPTRQSFIHELAGRSELKNAVSLNSIEVNLTRVIGPAIAAVVIEPGYRLVFLLERRLFRRGARVPSTDARRGPRNSGTCRAGKGPAARRPALRANHPRTARCPYNDGHNRDTDL